MQLAAEASELDDWGAPEFVSALDRLCHSANTEAGMTDAQEASFSRQLIDLLVRRLRLYGDRLAHWQIAEQMIIAPLFVVGFPRSGTTILHGLLAADPRARSPLAWELAAPSPPPRAATAQSDPRIAVAQAAIDVLPAQFKAMHAMGAMLPDEDNSIMQLAFRSLNFAASRPLPSYVTWLGDCDMAPAFALHRHMLQHLQAFNPRDWWVLKAPPHLFCLDALFATYPDARVIFTHRDPATIMPSNSSLIAFLHEMNGNTVDRRALGQAENAKWRTAMARAMAFREEHPELADRFHDMQFVDLTREPIGAIEAIYAHFDISFRDSVRAAMARFMAENAAGKHGTHTYSVDDFGMDADVIRTEFSDYCRAYNVLQQGVSA